jgi:hypothetical protein
METPQIRPGVVEAGGPVPRIVAYFYNAAQGNSAIQQLVGLGVRADQLGVTPPDQIESGQGMVLSIPCPDPALTARVEALCKSQGADLHHLHG